MINVSKPMVVHRKDNWDTKLHLIELHYYVILFLTYEHFGNGFKQCALSPFKCTKVPWWVIWPNGKPPGQHWGHVAGCDSTVFFRLAGGTDFWGCDTVEEDRCLLAIREVLRRQLLDRSMTQRIENVGLGPSEWVGQWEREEKGRFFFFLVFGYMAGCMSSGRESLGVTCHTVILNAF